MRLVVNKQNIPFTSLEWSGSKFSSARKISFSFPSSPTDTSLTKFKIETGDSVFLFNDSGDELFRGHIFRRDKTFQSNEVSFLAYDSLIYLLKSSAAYNFKTVHAGDVVKRIAKDTGFPVGTIHGGNTRIKLKPMINDSYYNILLETYKKVKSETRKRYFFNTTKGKLNVLESGQTIKGFTLENKKNLLDSNFSEDIENVINKVVIVDDKGNRVGSVAGEGLSKWGTFQAIYQKEKKKNSTTEAKKLLNGVQREASVSAMGDTRCLSGYGVQIKDSYTGLVGLFYIDEDSHTWQNGVHTMSLKLNFKNMMDGEE